MASDLKTAQPEAPAEPSEPPMIYAMGLCASASKPPAPPFQQTHVVLDDPEEPAESIDAQCWLRDAARVFIAVGDSEEFAHKQARYLLDEKDETDVRSAFEVALEDIEGRPEPMEAIHGIEAELTDETILERLDELHSHLTKTGRTNGGMVGVLWNCAAYRVAFATGAASIATPAPAAQQPAELTDEQIDALAARCTLHAGLARKTVLRTFARHVLSAGRGERTRPDDAVITAWMERHNIETGLFGEMRDAFEDAWSWKPEADIDAAIKAQGGSR